MLFLPIVRHNATPFILVSILSFQVAGCAEWLHKEPPQPVTASVEKPQPRKHKKRAKAKVRAAINNTESSTPAENPVIEETSADTETVKNISAYDYISYLSHARLSLQLGKTANSLSEDIDDLLAYHGVSDPIYAVLINYDANRTVQSLIAPIKIGSDSISFSYLGTLLNQLNAMPHTLNDVQLITLNVSADPDLSLDNVLALEQSLNTEQRRLLTTKAEPANMESAKIKVQLSKFLIESRIRDAAYLAVDNAKKSIARINPRNPEEELKTQHLSKELELLEKNLHSAMPFTLE